VVGAQQNVIEYQRILRGSTVATGVPMEEWPVYKILQLQIDEPAEGTPTKYALERTGVGSVATGSVTVGLWRLLIHPIASGAFQFSGWAFYEPPILASGGSLDTPDITLEQQRVLIRLTAWEAAGLLKRDERFLARIEKLIPPRYRVLLERQPEHPSIVARSAA